MCAVGGILHKVDFDSAKSLENLKRMGLAMRHRAPDGFNYFQDNAVGLLHGLLKIFSQEAIPGPYTSRDGRWILSFNGEVYNHHELAEIRNYSSDAEVILEGWARYGSGFLERVNGMFAFALWDSLDKVLYLVRDRLGEKPLYYHCTPNAFFFASEVKAFKAAGIEMKLDSSAAGDFLAYRYVPGENTLFAGIKKLLPGHVLSIDADLNVKKTSYWSPSARMSEPAEPEELESLLESSHRLRLKSIWQPAIYLSGGIDSACIASYLPKSSDAYTFTGANTVSEITEARELAQQFGLQHHEVQLTEAMNETLDKAIWALEEPIGDSIILANWALARAASEKTRVVMCGEGADELFAGYVHQWVFYQLTRLRDKVGPIGLRGLQFAIKNSSPAWLSRFVPYPAALGVDGRARLLAVIESMIQGKGIGAGFTTMSSPNPLTSKRLLKEQETMRLEDLLQLDQMTYLPDYSLLRMDKIPMSFAVEGRLPFLDHRIVEFANKLGAHDLIRGKHRKWILRQAMQERLGTRVAWRKKTPFIIDLSLGKNKSFVEAKQQFARQALESWMRVFNVF